MDVIKFPYGPLGSNMYVLIDDNSYIVIDPSCNPLIVKKYFEDNSIVPFDNLKAVFMTHGHFDHVMHVDSWHSLFPDISFFIGQQDIELLDEPELNCSLDFGNPIRFGVPAITFESVKDSFDFTSNIKCSVIHTPGHTNGHVVIVANCASDNNVLMFSGDMLFQGSIGRTDFATGDFVKMQQSIDLLKNLDSDAVVLPGHGPSTSLSIEKKTNPYFY